MCLLGYDFHLRERPPTSEELAAAWRPYVETCIEALQGNPEKLKAESADLLYHLMVLWADQGITPEDVLEVLQARQGTSGIAEKNSRTK